jgi:hypothetical protein
MPLRLLAYITEILLHHERQHGLPLPPVLSFVLHQGPERWTVATAIEDLFELPEPLASALAPFLPKFRHLLLDLSQADPSTEEGDAVLRIVLSLMKLARARQLRAEFFDGLGVELRHAAKRMPEGFLKNLLLYAFHTDADLDTESILDKLQHEPASRQTAMTIAQTLIAKGKAEGKAEGEAEGEARGKAEGEARGKAEGEARGKAEGKARGVWIGRIISMQELMGLETDTVDSLSELAIIDLERRHEELRREYDVRFRGH